MNYKEICNAIAILLTLSAFYPYIESIYQNKTKPHVFSWLIWGYTTSVVFFAQLADDGGVGAWSTGVSGLITIYVACLAYFKKADYQITKTDWVFFGIALLSLPLWYMTSNPLIAVLILTTVDLCGFAPTFRKAYVDPFTEQLLFYWITAFRFLLSVFALENYSITTVLFPVAIGVTSFAFVAMAQWRRKKLA